MRRLYQLFSTTGAVLVFALMACGQGKKVLSSDKQISYIKILEATEQRHFQGVRAAGPITEYRFVLIWQQETPPDYFFWSIGDRWMSCSIYSPHNLTTGALDLKTVRKGDTLEIIPTRKGMTAVPDGLALRADNSIYFKAGTSTWLSKTVKNLIKKPDVVMP